MLFKSIHTSDVVCFVINSFLVLSPFPPEVDGKERIDKFSTPLGRELVRLSKVADIKSSMDTKQDPCDDFYTYACGNWEKIHSGQRWVEKTDDVVNAMNQRINKFILHSKSRTDDKIFDFYRSCMDVPYNFNAFKAELKSVLQEFGQFSWLKAKSKEDTRRDFIWWSAVAKMYTKYGVTSIIRVYVDKHLKDHNRNILFIERPNDEENGVVTASFFKSSLEAPIVEVDQIVTKLEIFQNDLSYCGTDVLSGESPDETYTLYNTTDFQDQYQNLFDFESFLRISLNTTELPAQVYVSDKKYFDDLMDVINATDPNTVQDYILWSLAQEYDQGSVECISATKRYFGKYLQHTIYKQYRSGAYENEMFALWQDLKAAFQYALQTDRYPWMSNVTRQNAIQKLNKIKFIVNTYDDEHFEEFFRDLQIDPSNYAANVRNILKRIESMRVDKQQRTPDNFYDLKVESYSAVYYDRPNIIKVPVSNLQPFLMWHPDYPKAIKYAVLGNIFAHEMMHAFDDGGRYYDGNGCAKTWWDAESSNEYELRRHCFQVHYHNQFFGGHHLANSVAQRENIADNGGLNIAYLAYTRWLDRERQMGRDVDVSETFSNLPYTNRELFFISFAQDQCGYISPEEKSKIVHAEHSPFNLRINVPLSNSPAFSEVFKCDLKSTARMNPAEKCELF